MQSVRIYVSPRMREFDQVLTLKMLDDSLQSNGFPPQQYYIPKNQDKGITCDYIINEIPEEDASKLVSTINRGDEDYCARTGKVMGKRSLLKVILTI